MGKEAMQNLQDLQFSQEAGDYKASSNITDQEEGCNWAMIKEGGGVHDSASAHSSDSNSVDSTKEGSNSSTDLMEDASSSSSSSSSSLSGPLYEFSELMAQLPIKRGLSKYYDGKSQSFTSLASARSLEDLAKKDNPYNKRMKLCRSYGGGLYGHNQHHRFCTPKPTIAKKLASSRASCLSAVAVGRNNLFASCSRPPIPLQKQN